MGVPLKLLIVEDSEDDAALLLRELRLGGFEIEHERVDTPEALAASLNARNWDLFISDYSMPRFTGTDALRLVRTKWPDTPFIFVSGTMGEEAAVGALKNGAQDYLVKGNLKRLAPAVSRELRELRERKERRRLEDHVLQLQKFEAIGRLAGGIAHDFNNMIGAILGWAEMGYEDTPADSSAHERFQKIRDQSAKAAQLTSQILAFARRQVLQPRKTNLNDLIHEEKNLLQAMIGEQIQIRYVTATDLCAAMVDPAQIEQVLMNLCVNARDAMPTGGTITIETRNTEIDAEFCRIHPHARPGNYVLLSVSDTGVGMDAATRELIFEPFFTTKEMGRGTGLGLATVYGIVKQHEGFIYADSELGKGTAFQVYLPVVAGVGIPETRDSMTARAPRGTETILLADDHEGLRDSAKEMLEGLGYRVLLAANGAEAVQLLKTYIKEISLVVLDVMMPVMTGPDAFSQMAVLRPGLRVIFTTGYATEASSLKWIREKQFAIVQKPYRLKQLCIVIRSTIDKTSLA